MVESWGEGFVGVAVGGDSSGGHGGVGGAVVCVPEAYDLVASGVASGDLEGGLVGFGAAVAEECLGEGGVGDLGEAFGEVYLGLV